MSGLKLRGISVIVLAIACATVIFGLAVLAMAIGLMLRGKVMRGGCGSHSGPAGAPLGCDACSKKQLNLCDEEDATGLAGPSFAATLGRFTEKRDPSVHHEVPEGTEGQQYLYFNLLPQRHFEFRPIFLDEIPFAIISIVLTLNIFSSKV